jgi:ribulose-5-phosphate 4-epimerase/fuculose-1-phosphate aldolase
MLENHGICIGAASISEAYLIFETLEYAARSELLARRLGSLNVLSEDRSTWHAPVTTHA